MANPPAFRTSSLDPQKDSLEEVATWGLRPALEMLEFIDDIINRDSGDLAEINTVDRMGVFINEIKAKLEDVQDKIHDYDTYFRQIKGRLRDLSPDDPLLDGHQQCTETKEQEV